MIVAAAQTVPKDGAIAENLSDHDKLARLAAKHGARLILFPEMSLTGYQRSNASKLSFIEDDARLNALRDVASDHDITIVAGAPLRLVTGLHIGAFMLFPDRTVSIYTKQFLHTGEDEFFSPNDAHNPTITLGDERCALAICADIANPRHPERASQRNATLYLASLFYTPTGIVEGHTSLASYARTYGFAVLMANYGGPSFGLESGGKSAFWDQTGNVLSAFDGNGEGVLIVEKRDECWQARVLNQAGS
jgi:predicted amidohydrolase